MSSLLISTRRIRLCDDELIARPHVRVCELALTMSAMMWASLGDHTHWVTQPCGQRAGGWERKLDEKFFSWKLLKIPPQKSSHFSEKKSHENHLNFPFILGSFLTLIFTLFSSPIFTDFFPTFSRKNSQKFPKKSQKKLPEKWPPRPGPPHRPPFFRQNFPSSLPLYQPLWYTRHS